MPSASSSCSNWGTLRQGMALRTVAHRGRQETTGTENLTVPRGWGEPRGQELQVQPWSLSPSEVGTPPKQTCSSPFSVCSAVRLAPVPTALSAPGLTPHGPQLTSIHPPSCYNVKSQFLKLHYAAATLSFPPWKLPLVPHSSSFKAQTP